MKQEQLKHLYEIGNEETKKYLETELSYKIPFEVGDFIASKEYLNFFGLITKIEGRIFYYDGFREYNGYDENGKAYFDDNDHHPTKEEIEQHIIKVAELKGYKNGVEVKNIYDNNERLTLTEGFEYDEKNGLFAYYAEDHAIMIWNKETNTWAEIIEPKKWSVQKVCDDYELRYNGERNAIFFSESLAENICNLLNNKK